MFTRAQNAMFVVAGLLCAVASPGAYARDVRVLRFTFDVPDSWYVEGQGGSRLFATGGKGKDSLPWVIAEACEGESQCKQFRLPDPPNEFASMGCTGSQVQHFTWPTSVAERRWICGSAQVSDVAVASGISIFEVPSSILFIAYSAGDSGPSVPEFLKRLASTMRIVSP